MRKRGDIRELITGWHDINLLTPSPVEYLNSGKVKAQIIWGNDLIKFNKKPLYFSNWIKSNIIYINDLLNEKGELQEGYIRDKLVDKRNWMVETCILKRAIPKDWYEMILEEKGKIHVEPKVFLNPDIGTLDKLNTKAVYSFIIEHKSKIPVVQEKWEQTISEEINWNLAWKRKIKEIKETRLRDFNYKFMQQIIPTDLLLYKWKLKNNPLCQKCNAIDDYEHAFLLCKNVVHFWNSLVEYINSRTNLLLDIPSMADLVTACKYNSVLCTITSLGMYCIFQSKMMAYNGKQNVNTFRLFTKELSFRAKMLKNKDDFWKSLE